ncbi:MAG: vitamin B12-dependent ribonucleotide reductase [Synergistales bacterium]
MAPEEMKPGFSENAVKVLGKRYLRKDEAGKVNETPAELLWRVANAVAAAEKQWGFDRQTRAEEFYGIMSRLLFLPNSPTLMNAGSDLGQLSACFVLPIGDSMEEIFDTLKATALVHKSGGGTGFNFSKIRPAGDIVRSTSGVASGPISFMELFNDATEVVKQGGMRRGANMGILEASHPDIFDFIKAKTTRGRLANFNLSVGIPDALMQAVKENGEWDLRNPRSGEVVSTVKAAELFDLLVESAWASGDPGLVFLDRINDGNPTPQAGRIESTNPCGEQPLLPYESCNLGSINLVRFLDEEGRFDWEKLGEVVETAVRFLDDVIEMNHYPIPPIGEQSRQNRKIGLGIMGWAEVLFEKGIPYGSQESVSLAEEVMSFIQSRGHEASEALAEERGCFPNWEGSVWGKQGRKMRNATVTTIAPTGTLSILADCSSGIEPVFALAYRRKTFETETLSVLNGILLKRLEERGLMRPGLLEAISESGSLEGLDLPEEVRRVFQTSHEIPFEAHVRMQAAFQRFTDNAVSKTINLPNEADREDIRRAFWLSYESGCKGITVYRDRCKESQVLYSGSLEKPEAQSKESPTLPRRRPSMLRGTTVKIMTGFGNLYLTVNEMDSRPFEVFATLGKSGKDTQAHTEALGRLISLALRSGVPVEEVVSQLKGIGGSQPVWEADGIILSLPDAIARGLERAGGFKVDSQGAEMCPSCGSSLIHSEGCIRCRSCDFSKCD